jgi:putative nucleotidyltransferase with HDIG domain
LTRTLTKEERIAKAGKLATLPPVARKMLDLLEREDTSAAQIQGVLETDQALTARVLKIANSAFYGLRGEVKSPRHAIMVLGFATLRSLVVAASAQALHRRFGLTERMMWEHSVGVSIGAKVIARAAGMHDLGETCFIGGLLHDLGKTVLNNDTPERYAEVMMRMYNEGVGSLEAEVDLYGFGHDEIGAGVAEKWGFPGALVEVIALHHRFEAGEAIAVEEPGGMATIAIVSLADHVARHYGIGQRRPEPDIDLAKLRATVLLRLDPAEVPALAERCREAVEAEKGVFA